MLTLNCRIITDQVQKPFKGSLILGGLILTWLLVVLKHQLTKQVLMYQLVCVFVVVFFRKCCFMSMCRPRLAGTHIGILPSNHYDTFKRTLAPTMLPFNTWVRQYSSWLIISGLVSGHSPEVYPKENARTPHALFRSVSACPPTTCIRIYPIRIWRAGFLMIPSAGSRLLPEAALTCANQKC